VLLALLTAACTGTEGAPEPVDPPPTTVDQRDADTYAPGWAAVHADAANSDHAPVPGARALAPSWARDFDGDVRVRGLEWTINVGPTSDADQLYLTTSVAGCHLQALDRRTGETRWCAPEVGGSAVVSSPLLDDDGRLFVADEQAMYGFDRDGRQLWRHPIVGVPLSAQFTPSGRVLFVTHVGVVHVLDRDTGEAAVAPLALVPDPAWDPAQGLWACARGTDGCPSANTPAVDLDTGRVYLTFWAPGTPQAGLMALQVDEGPDPSIEVVWSTAELPGGSASSPALSEDGGRLYVTDNVDALHAIDTATGRTVWSQPIGAAPGGSASLSPDGLIIPAGGPLQVVRDDGDHATVLWRDDQLRNRGVATQAEGGVAYATVGRSPEELDVVVVDLATGQVLDREALPGPTRFSVGITVGLDGTVYVPTISGGLFAFTPA
jgi:outer membrane protein assembly factor BamB